MTPPGGTSNSITTHDGIEVMTLGEQPSSSAEPSLEVTSDEGEFSEEDRLYPKVSAWPPKTNGSGSLSPEEYSSRLPVSSKRELLELAANMHFGGEGNSREALRENSSVMETRSSLSSKGRGKISERLKNLSRSQKKSLLSRKMIPSPPPPPPLSPLARQNSLLEEEEYALSPTSSRNTAQTAKQSSGKLVHYAQDLEVPLLTQGLDVNSSEESRMGSDRELDLALLREELQSRGGIEYPTTTEKRSNDIKLHIYDLISRDTLVQLPWGCVCAVGKCFTDFNSALHQLGTGAYHVGVEVNGTEYAFGATSTAGKSGVFSCIPKFSPGYQYRTTVEFGSREVVRRNWVSVREEGKTKFHQVETYVDGRQIMKEMAPDYMGTEYDILRKNCCTFARDACLRLGVPDEEIPTWFRNLADAGAMTQDLAASTVEPITNVLSACDEEKLADDRLVVTEEVANGFEIVAHRNPAGTKDYLMVMEAKHEPVALRRTVSWT